MDTLESKLKFDPEEEKKKEEAKKEAEKPKEETKTEEPKKEEKKDEPKKEEKKEQDAPKVENTERPKEPKPKIPSDFTESISQLKSLKEEGNTLIKEDLDAALAKYEEGYQLSEKVMETASQEREYNPQVAEIDTVRKQIMSNLALAYFKKENYKKSAELDIKVISMDSKYDKSYARLFKAYAALGNTDQAVYFGNKLKTSFTPETVDKYKDLLPLIEEEEKKQKKTIDEYKAVERSKTMKSIAKYAVPLLVLVAAGLAYFFFFKKKN